VLVVVVVGVAGLGRTPVGLVVGGCSMLAAEEEEEGVGCRIGRYTR